MYPRRTHGKIFPKISTLPRQHTEASHYLDLYKLTVEKKRLQTELQNLEERRQRIQQRLTEIEGQTLELEQGAQTLREGDKPLSSEASLAAPAPISNVYLPENYSPESYSPETTPSNTPNTGSTFFLEY